MFFFERLFGVYYFMLLKVRKFNNKFFRSDEDFQAVSLVCIAQITLIGMVLVILKELFNIYIPISAIYMIILCLIILYLNYKYFLSKRERRNEIVDSFRVLSKTQKIIWRLIGILIFIIPILVIYFVQKIN